MEEKQFEMVAGSTTKVMAETEGKRIDFWQVPPEHIRVKEGFNVRQKDEVYFAAVREYADSMKANGFYRDKPLACFVAHEDGKDVIYVIDGHTRLDAVLLAISEGASIEKIPVVIKPAGTSMADMVVSMATGNAGRNLSPLSVAVVCKRLIGYGLTEEEIATRLSMTPTYVNGLLRLVASPKKILDMVSKGQVSATLAIDTIKKHGVDAHGVLQDGLAVAEASGKQKVTKKNIGGSKEKPVVKKVNAWKAGIEYVKQNSLADNSSVIGLLALVTGKSEEEILEALTAPQK